MDYADVIAAAARIAPYLAPTPLLASRLSQGRGLELRLKPECRQTTGSFKIRGAANKILTLPAGRRAAGVVTASSGNHGLAVAHIAALLGISATVVVPEAANDYKIAAARARGARIVIHGRDSAQRRDKALAISQDSGAAFIHSHDDPAVIAGQGTLAAELLADWPDLDAIVVPVGGGGLLAGISLIKQLYPTLAVIGVQPAGNASAARSFRRGEIVANPAVDTVADGLRAAKPGSLNFALIQKYADDIVTVSDDEILAATLALLDQDKILAEPSGAAAVAAVLAGRLPSRLRRVAAVISGGNIAIPRLFTLFPAPSAPEDPQPQQKE